jgi:Tfp pilus assembly protein PilX
MPAPPRNGERGMALFFALFALILLTALTSALVLLTSTETSINFNYRSEEVAFFAAKAGLEEVLTG